jgi:hypothetical protein
MNNPVHNWTFNGLLTKKLPQNGRFPGWHRVWLVYITKIYETVESRYSTGNWHRCGGDHHADRFGVQGPAGGSEERDPGTEEDIDGNNRQSAYRNHR